MRCKPVARKVNHQDERRPLVDQNEDSISTASDADSCTIKGSVTDGGAFERSGGGRGENLTESESGSDSELDESGGAFDNFLACGDGYGERNGGGGQVSPSLSLRSLRSSEENSRSHSLRPSRSGGSSQNGKKYPCGQCGRALTDIASLQRHLRAQHTSPRIHACAECGKTFATSSGLKQHAHIHSSVKPFQCEVCLKSYTQFSNLCRHKRMHADCRAQSRCEKCTAPFASSAALAKHKRFCDVASSVNSQKVTTRLQGSIVPTFAGNLNGIHKERTEDREKSGLFGVSPPVTSEGQSIQKRIPPPPPPNHHHPAMEALRLEILNNQNKVLHHQRIHRKRARDQLQLQPVPPPEGPNLGQGSPKSQRSPRQQPPPPPPPQQPFPLVFPSPLPMYNPFAAALCPQFFGSMTPKATPPRRHSPPPPPPMRIDLKEEQSEVIDYTKPKSPGSVKSEAPLDLSVQKNVVSEESISSTVNSHGTPPVVTVEKLINEREDSPLIENLRAKKQHRSRDSITLEQNNNVRKDNSSPELAVTTDKRRKSPTPPNVVDNVVVHDHGGLRNGSAFSQIIAPRPLHPFPRFSHPPPSHFPPMFPQNPFNPFFPPNISPRNDLNVSSNNFNTANGPWPTKIGNRYSCRYCGKIFPRSANLTRHLRTHTGEQPYKCRFCERSFSISSNLQRHVRNIHHKEKPFRCGLCGRSFGQQTNLDRHVRKHESGDVLDLDHEDSSSPSPSPPLRITLT